ncbi:hypothetical protein F4V91_14405 [Neorhizobium galegae]|uniref:Uncharacterized protein n=1 Tax=Neorhizobium galegae TaxID=399 RepID=A0A6A1TTE7_NEOGA|nr:hypothetical protein [Neorhizobium galegae]KAB1087516.1 hypothetical protein F4V91_14405 [Neorhizobium galegae]
MTFSMAIRFLRVAISRSASLQQVLTAWSNYQGDRRRQPPLGKGPLRIPALERNRFGLALLGGAIGTDFDKGSRFQRDFHRP